MIETAALAGFFTAHSIWSVSEGEALIPILGYEQPDGERGMNRYELGDLGDSARAAHEALELNENGAARAVVITDAYLNLDEGRTDALIVNAVGYGPHPASFQLAVPYRPATDPSGFGVGRPMFLEVTGFGEDLDALADAFFDGVGSHEQAAPVWAAHML